MEFEEGRPDTGLHDIQKLAAAHKAQEEERQAAELRANTPLHGTPVPSVVGMPVHAVSHRPRWVYVAGGAIFVVVAAAASVFVLARHATGGAVAAAAVLPAEQPAPAPAVAPKAAEPAVQQLPVAEPAQPEKVAPVAKAHVATHAAKAAPAPKAEKAEKPEKAPKAEAAKPAAPAPAPANARDELDQLLATSTADDARGKVAAPAADDGNLPEAPSREAITAAMGKIKGRVNACYEKFQQNGVATVEVSIGKNGKVQSANVTGKFADSDTGSCVASAVKAASFPRFKGPTLKIDYPFLLQAQ